MSRSPLPRRVGLTLVTLAVTGATGLLGVAGAAPSMASTASTRCVVVVVDAHLLDGSAADTRCAAGDPSSGFQTLSKAGFSYDVRPRDGLVCRIDGRPQCTDTTSEDYWSYWVRAPGKTAWTYANEGPGTHDPKPCSGEAWVWQHGGKVSPPRVPAAAGCTGGSGPAPTSATPGPTAGGGSGGATSHPAQHAGSATGHPAPSPGRSTSTTARPSPRPGSTSAPAVAAPSATGSAIASASASVSGAPASGERGPGPGGPALTGGAGAALGGMLVVGLGSAAVLLARRGGSP